MIINMQGKPKKLMRKIKLRHFNKFLFNKVNLEVYRFDQSPNLQGFLKYLQKAGIDFENVYDVGAHKGDWTKSISKTLANAQFFLFEPNQIHNDSLNSTGFPIFNYLLGQHDGQKVEFYAAGQTGDSFLRENNPIYNDSVKQEMLIHSLDSVQVNEKLPLPDLLKLDTQGSELLILRGAEHILSNVSVIVIELPVTKMNIGAPSFSEVVNFLQDHDFVPIQIVEIHRLIDILVQVDIAFMSRRIFIETFGHDDIYHR